jgi:hypothetical protein
MRFPRGHQVFAVEIEKHLTGAYRSHNVRIDICHGIAGDLERERPAVWMPVFLAKFLKVIGYLAVNIGQTHICS